MTGKDGVDVKISGRDEEQSERGVETLPNPYPPSTVNRRPPDNQTHSTFYCIVTAWVHPLSAREQQTRQPTLNRRRRARERNDKAECVRRLALVGLALDCLMGCTCRGEDTSVLYLMQAFSPVRYMQSLASREILGGNSN